MWRKTIKIVPNYLEDTLWLYEYGIPRILFVNPKERFPRGSRLLVCYVITVPHDETFGHVVQIATPTVGAKYGICLALLWWAQGTRKIYCHEQLRNKVSRIVLPMSAVAGAGFAHNPIAFQWTESRYAPTKEKCPCTWIVVDANINSLGLF